MVYRIMQDSQNVICLSQIWIYPVKSLGGVRLQNAQLLEEGLQYDRHWMIVDTDGNFLTQRKFPDMSLLKISMFAEGFWIHPIKENDTPLFVCFTPDSDEQMAVKVWNDTVVAIVVGREADRWLSEQLRMQVRLVTLPTTYKRETFIEHIHTAVPITFADDFPIHIISEPSLANLNSRLDQPVGIERFRPNLVITGGVPFAEDHWQKFQIGEAIFGNISGCERCVMININQHSGVKTTEPLRTLAGYRRIEKHILFGRNVICEKAGTIREGDTVYILA